MFRLILIFAVIIYHVHANERIICDSNYTKNLNKNQIVFFESPNFPLTFDSETKEKCKLSITGNPDEENMVLIFAVTNGHPVGGQIFDNRYMQLIEFPIIDYYITFNNSLEFSFTNNETRREWEGFQGFIAYEKFKYGGCPLANKNDPFIFKNESEVLYLRSSYFRDLTIDIYDFQQKECVWNFLAPEGYSFKILSLYADSKVLIIANDERQTIQSHLPFYFHGTNITVAYTASYENYLITDKAFLARISIINLAKSESNDYCSFNETAQTWATPAHKYVTKVKCQKSFAIEKGHQLYALVTSLETTGPSDIKHFIDVLRYFIDENLLYPVPFARIGLYAFLPYSDGTTRNLTLEYTSDESLIYNGFSITFKDVECKCGPSTFVIPCGGEHNYSIMANNDFYYCAELRCNFTIVIDQACPNKTILLKAFPDFQEYYFTTDNSSNLKVISDSHVLIDTDGVYKRTYEGRNRSALILPHRNNHLIFTSTSEQMGYRSIPIGSLRIWATSFEEPTHLPKQLITAKEPFFVFKSNEISANQVLTLELSEDLITKNETLEMFYETSNAKHLLHCLILYFDESMETIMKIDLTMPNIVVDTSLTIYKHTDCDDDLTKLIIRAKNCKFLNFPPKLLTVTVIVVIILAHSKICRFQNNIVNIGEIMKENAIVTMVSDPKHPCTFTLINNVEFYVIKEILVSSKNESVFIYNGHDRSHKMLELNRTSSTMWKQMTMNSLSYSIEIPPSSSLYIEFYEPLYSINFTEPLFSYYETPFYGTQSFKPFSSNTTYSISEHLEAIFTVLDFDLSNKAVLQLIYSNGYVIHFTSHNQQTIVRLKPNETVNIFYNETEIGYKGAMIGINVKDKSLPVLNNL